MPSRASVHEFVSMIEAGQFLEALEKFYAEDMTAQENDQAPRVGKAAQRANEEAALKRMRFDLCKVVSYLVDGDRVAINYVFEMSTPKGDRFKMDEIAFQRWSGEKIVSERYFYDPAQRQPLPRSA